MRRHFITIVERKYFITSNKNIGKLVPLKDLKNSKVNFGSMWLKNVVGGGIKRIIKEYECLQLLVFEKDYLSKFAPSEYIIKDKELYKKSFSNKIVSNTKTISNTISNPKKIKIEKPVKIEKSLKNISIDDKFDYVHDMLNP